MQPSHTILHQLQPFLLAPVHNTHDHICNTKSGMEWNGTEPIGASADFKLVIYAYCINFI